MKRKIIRTDRFEIEIESQTDEEALEKAYEEDDSNYEYLDCDYEIDEAMNDCTTAKPLEAYLSAIDHLKGKERLQAHLSMLTELKSRIESTSLDEES